MVAHDKMMAFCSEAERKLKDKVGQHLAIIGFSFGMVYFIF
jgi:hypothetical protein